MKKNHKKAVALAGVGLATVAGVAVMEAPVHADNVTTQAPNSTSNNVQGNDLKAKQDESRHVYADAKAKEQQTQSAMDKAASADSQAQVDLKSAAVAESTAATTLSQDKQNASDAQTKYDSAVSKAAQTGNRDDIKGAQDSYNQAKSDLQLAESDQAVKSAAANSATKADDQAGQNLKDQQNAESNARGAWNKAQADETTAENNLANAKDHEATIQNDTADVKAKTDAKDKADRAVSDAQSQVQSTSDAVKKVQNDLDATDNSLPTFKFSDEQKRLTQVLAKEWRDYCQNLNSHGQGVGSKDITKMPSYNSWASALSYPGEGFVSVDKLSKFLGVNWVDNNENDKATILNPNNLTIEGVQELSRWTAAILNELTQQLGIQEIVGKVNVTPGMIGVAKEVAELTSENNQSGVGHYLYGLNKATYDYGLERDTHYVTDQYKDHCYTSNPFGESAQIGEITGKYSQYTVASAKEEILRTIVDMLTMDAAQGMGHTTALLGLNNLIYGKQNAEGQILGVSISGNINSDHDISNPYTIHIIGYCPSELDNSNDSMKQKQQAMKTLTVVANPYDDLAATKAKLEGNLATAKENATKAQTDLATAKTNQQNAITALNDANTKLKQDQTNVMTVADAQATLNTAKTTLSQKQTDLQKAKDAVTQATKAKDTTAANLATANEALTKARDNYNQAQNTYNQAKSKLDQLTSAYQAVTNANNKLTSANQALQKAQDEYAKAQDALTKATAAAKAAAQAHTEATAEHGKAYNALITAQNNLITDRMLYADSVRLKPVGDVYVNSTTLPKVEIANPMVKDPTEDLLYTQFLKMASSELDSIPTGTVVGWMTGFKIMDDMKQPGTYTEDALVTFPDGSSFTLPATFTVKAAPATPGNSTGTAGQPGGSQSVAGDQGNGTGVTGNQTTGMVTGASQGMMNYQTQVGQQAGANGQMKLSAQARSQQTQANVVLPQTGADHDQGLLALGMAGLVTMFGLFGINRKQRN